MVKMLAAGCFLVGLGLTILAHQALDQMASPGPLPERPQRIVSLAPSITETFYAMGLGQAVVGVTSYCAWPPEVRKKPAVAGFSEINYEAVLALKPDLVALPIDRNLSRAELERLGLAVLLMDTRSLSGVMDSIGQIGRATGRDAEANQIFDHMRTSLDRARQRASGQARPSVLFSVMHSYEGLGHISQINIVGRDGFYDQLLELAGAVNAYQGRLAFPRLSREAIIYLDPEVIIDIIPDGFDLATIKADWQSLSTVRAIKNNRLFFLSEEATIPGPRFPATLDRLSAIFHPDAQGMTP